MSARGLGKIGEFAELALHVVADLGRIDEERRPARRRHDGEGERDRRVLDVAAPDIEQPGDGIEQGEEHGVGLLRREQRLHVADLLVRAAPGIFETMRHDLRPTRASAGPAR